MRSTGSATKAALVGMTRATAVELGEYGITVNCIAPGPFLTDLPGRLLSAEEKERSAPQRLSPTDSYLTFAKFGTGQETLRFYELET